MPRPARCGEGSASRRRCAQAAAASGGGRARPTCAAGLGEGKGGAAQARILSFPFLSSGPGCHPARREAPRHGAGSRLERAGAALRRLAAHRRGLAAPVLAGGGPAGAVAAAAAAGGGGGGGRGPGAARRAARPPVPAGAVAAGLGAGPQQPGAPARGMAGHGRAGPRWWCWRWAEGGCLAFGPAGLRPLCPQALRNPPLAGCRSGSLWCGLSGAGRRSVSQLRFLGCCVSLSSALEGWGA